MIIAMHIITSPNIIIAPAPNTLTTIIVTAINIIAMIIKISNNIMPHSHPFIKDVEKFTS